MLTLPVVSLCWIRYWIFHEIYVSKDQREEVNNYVTPWGGGYIPTTTYERNLSGVWLLLSEPTKETSRGVALIMHAGMNSQHNTLFSIDIEPIRYCRVPAPKAFNYRNRWHERLEENTQPSLKLKAKVFKLCWPQYVLTILILSASIIRDTSKK